MELASILGKRLKYLRERRGLAQKYVAEKIGVRNNTLSGYESGRREPDTITLQKLANFYDVTSDYLLGLTDNPSRNNSKEQTLKEFLEKDGVEYDDGIIIPKEDLKPVREILDIIARERMPKYLEEQKKKNRDEK